MVRGDWLWSPGVAQRYLFLLQHQVKESKHNSLWRLNVTAGRPGDGISVPRHCTCGSTSEYEKGRRAGGRQQGSGKGQQQYHDLQDYQFAKWDESFMDGVKFAEGSWDSALLLIPHIWWLPMGRVTPPARACETWTTSDRGWEDRRSGTRIGYPTSAKHLVRRALLYSPVSMLMSFNKESPLDNLPSCLAFVVSWHWPGGDSQWFQLSKEMFVVH
jgi:hypothetical protein